MATLIIIIICFALVRLEYACVFGNSLTSPTRKHCYVIENDNRSHGIGLFSIPQLQCLPYYLGKIVFEKRDCTLISAKIQAMRLKLRNPKKKYIVCFHY